jgi:hypothetical protein
MPNVLNGRTIPSRKRSLITSEFHASDVKFPKFSIQYVEPPGGRSSIISENIHTANEVPVRIKYKRPLPIYIFPEMKLRGLVIYKTE